MAVAELVAVAVDAVAGAVGHDHAFVAVIAIVVTVAVGLVFVGEAGAVVADVAHAVVVGVVLVGVGVVSAVVVGVDHAVVVRVVAGIADVVVVAVGLVDVRCVGAVVDGAVVAAGGGRVVCADVADGVVVGVDVAQSPAATMQGSHASSMPSPSRSPRFSSAGHESQASAAPSPSLSTSPPMRMTMV